MADTCDLNGFFDHNTFSGNGFNSGFHLHLDLIIKIQRPTALWRADGSRSLTPIGI